MDSEDGELFVKQLASFVRTHEKALANALQVQRRETRHRPSQSTSSATIPKSPTLPDRPATSASATGSIAATLSLGNLNLTSQNVKSARLALTPHHLFYLLSRFEELGIAVGPMKVRLENLHDTSTAANYVSFLSNTQRSRSRDSDVGSIRSVSSVRSVMSGMSALWASLGIGASISAARTERQKAALQADLKYLYSAFTKIPCLRLAPDWRARLIKGYEEFPFDSAVPLYVFKNLQSLEISGIDFRQFFGWDRVADQLRSLTIRRAGIEDPADIILDIVLDDMDRRRRRTSKSQSTPTGTSAYHGSPRRGSIVPELHRSMTAPGYTEPRTSANELNIGSLSPNTSAVDEGHNSDTAKHPASNDPDDFSKSPYKNGRQRSKSPGRPGHTRNHSAHIRSQRMNRSGSGSSQSSLSDSWHHYPKSTSGLATNGALPASKWRFLRHLSLADNSMTAISPTSLAPLANTLYSLDLSSNLFSQIPDSLATLTALRALNLSHCMIDSVQSLKRNPLPAITALNLRANRLSSLAGIEKLYPLERLDLRDNRLSDPMELARLTGIPDIREIWVEANPFTRTHRDYRVTIFNLFRKMPGYTEDVIIDGSGPSYSERRLLVDRAPIPDSVPVVKPVVPELPAVDVNKPNIVYGAPKESPVTRKERPMPKAVMSEIHTSSQRRRKTPKRRIIDLATGETPPSPTSIDMAGNISSPMTDSSDAFSLQEENYRISQAAETKLLPPLVLPDNRQNKEAPADVPRNGGVVPVFTSPETSVGGSKESQDWRSDNTIYHHEIEALRDKVGNGHLRAMSDGNSSSNGAHTFESPTTVATAPLTLRPAHSPHSSSVQSIHSNRPLGQPLSS